MKRLQCHFQIETTKAIDHGHFKLIRERCSKQSSDNMFCVKHLKESKSYMPSRILEMLFRSMRDARAKEKV